jgi:PKHD-type hydroxylase
MTKLSNVPLWKQLFFTSKVIDNNVFTMDEIDWISNYCKNNLEINKGQLFESNPDYSTREALTGWISNPNSDTLWIYERLNQTIEKHNDYVFNLDLSGIPYIQYTEYLPGGHHDFHMDLAMDVPYNIDYKINEFFRKLTVVVLLTAPEVDFGGGEFQLNISMERTPLTAPMVKGSVLIFPSFLLHKVNPVLWGLRKTLVTWVIGPKFK